MGEGEERCLQAFHEGGGDGGVPFLTKAQVDGGADSGGNGPPLSASRLSNKSLKFALLLAPSFPRDPCTIQSSGFSSRPLASLLPPPLLPAQSPSCLLFLPNSRCDPSSAFRGEPQPPRGLSLKIHGCQVRWTLRVLLGKWSHSTEGETEAQMVQGASVGH